MTKYVITSVFIGTWWIKGSNEQNLLEIFCNVINVFTVIFEKKILLTPIFFKGIVYFPSYFNLYLILSFSILTIAYIEM